MAAVQDSMSGARSDKWFTAGIALAAVTALLTVWTTVVRDDGNAAGNFMVVLAAAVGAFAAGLKSPGMARAMLGVAVMNAAMGGLMATDPSTPHVARAVLWTVVLCAMWLASAAFFWSARESGAAAYQRTG